ncbi:unnamed protein product [[Candida] boidinii]|nr:unnamed protein product [[Candida] boidinii]
MYKFDSDGLLIEAIAPPEAFLPLRDGNRSFASNNPPIYDRDLDVGDNQSGRSDNQGFEGAALSTDGKYLYSLLQSANVQDGGSEKYTNSNARMVKYDITKSTPELVGEYVFPLPTYYDPEKKAKKNPRTAAQSEILFLSEDLFLVLSRDSNHGCYQHCWFI